MVNIDELIEKNSRTVYHYTIVIEQLKKQKKDIEQEIEMLKKDVGVLMNNNIIINALNVIEGKYGNLKSDEFIEAICGFWGITSSKLFEKNRIEELVYRRVIMAKLLKIYYPKKTLVNFGKMFDQDHTTIIRLLENFDKFYMDSNNIKFQEALKPVAHFFLDITKTNNLFEESSVVANGS